LSKAAQTNRKETVYAREYNAHWGPPLYS